MIKVIIRNMQINCCNLRCFLILSPLSWIQEAIIQFKMLSISILYPWYLWQIQKKKKKRRYGHVFPEFNVDFIKGHDKYHKTIVAAQRLLDKQCQNDERLASSWCNKSCYYPDKHHIAVHWQVILFRTSQNVKRTNIKKK